MCVYLHGFTCIWYFWILYTLSKTIHIWSMMIYVHIEHRFHRTTRGPRDQFCGGRGSVKSGMNFKVLFCFFEPSPPPKKKPFVKRYFFWSHQRVSKKNTNEGWMIRIPHCQVVHQFFLRLLDDSRSYCRHAAATKISIRKQCAHVCVYIYIQCDI